MRGYTYRAASGCHLAISNLWYRNECSVADIEDIVEESKTGIELMNGLNNLNLFEKFTIDKETETKVRLKSVDFCGNTHYFEAIK